VIGRYALYDPIASGGMATVHLGRLLGPVGFSRTVAIKRSHPEMAADPEFVSMFLDEARLAARIRHPNVVSTLDVVALEGELFLVMDFVQGESLSRLMRASKTLGQPIPPPVACTIMAGALHGLHAAHEAKNERGEPLRIVHRDVSPQNILVGVDGIARVLDFGVAKAVGRVATTREGQIKGKISYLAPEQVGGSISRQSDIYAAAVVLWEALTSERLFSADNPGELLHNILNRRVPPPSELVKGLPPALDTIVLRGLAREPADRFATAREMAVELERNGGQVSAVEIGEWVERVAKEALAARAKKVAEIEHHSPHEPLSPSASSGADEAAALAEERQRREGRHHTSTTVAEVGYRGEDRRSAAVSAQEWPSPPTDASIASIAKSPSAEPRGKRAWFAAAGAALVILAVVGATGLRSYRRVSSHPSAQAPSAPSTPTLAPQPAPSPPPEIAVSSAPAIEPPAEPPVETIAKARSDPGTSNKTRPPARHPPRKAVVDCSFPYIIDGNGIQHIRKECLN
jgi:eukaryotic-like serine/threonine-protein kinase